MNHLKKGARNTSMNAWHKQSIPEVTSLLATNVEQVLADKEVAVRLARYGPNKLRKGRRFSALVIFVSWQIGMFSNIRLFLVVAVSFALQLAIHHVAMFQTLFKIEPVTLNQCVGWFAVGFIPLIVLELRKVIRLRATGYRP